jgi:hypothetical protein
MELAEQAIFNPVHIVRVADKRMGETKCLVRLRETQAQGAPLTLISSNEDIFSPKDDNSMRMDNATICAVISYIGVINKRRLEAFVFEKGRKTAQHSTMKARRLADVTGAERGDVQARIQRYEILKHYLPRGFTARHEVTGAVTHELFDRIVRLAKARDKTVELQQELAHYAVVNEEDGTIGIYEGLPSFKLDPDGKLSWSGPSKSLPFVGHRPSPIPHLPRP